jgi:hypothetical protein
MYCCADDVLLCLNRVSCEQQVVMSRENRYSTLVHNLVVYICSTSVVEDGMVTYHPMMYVKCVCAG